MPQHYNTRRHQQYTLTATPVQIAAPLTGGIRISVTILNPSTLLNGSANTAIVTLANNTDAVNVFTLIPGASITDKDANDAWYAAAPSGTGVVQIIEVSSS